MEGKRVFTQKKIHHILQKLIFEHDTCPGKHIHIVFGKRNNEIVEHFLFKLCALSHSTDSRNYQSPKSEVVHESKSIQHIS